MTQLAVPSCFLPSLSSSLAAQLFALSFGGCSACSGRYITATRTAERLPELISQSLLMYVH